MVSLRYTSSKSENPEFFNLNKNSPIKISILPRYPQNYKNPPKNSIRLAFQEKRSHLGVKCCSCK
jgi:hypothetical protein